MKIWKGIACTCFLFGAIYGIASATLEPDWLCMLCGIVNAALCVFAMGLEVGSNDKD